MSSVRCSKLELLSLKILVWIQVIYAIGWKEHESQPQPLQRGTAKTRIKDVIITKSNNENEWIDNDTKRDGWGKCVNALRPLNWRNKNNSNGKNPIDNKSSQIFFQKNQFVLFFLKFESL